MREKKIKGPGGIEKTFEALREKGRKALIAFVTAGDPDLGTTKRMVLELERAGADMIELGIPFSDPMADGPTIQASSERALSKGVTVRDVLGTVKELRKKTDIPVILFGYYNPIFAYGLKRFAGDAKKAGVDGVLVVDLPPEEAGELKGELDREKIDLIFLLTPTSNTDRLRTVTAQASGFIYYVSLTGVTGARKSLSMDIKDHLQRIRRFSELPVAVGFGISTPGQAETVARFADGVVVGSAIIDVIGRNIGSKDLVKKVGRFVSSLKRGVERASSTGGRVHR